MLREFNCLHMLKNLFELLPPVQYLCNISPRPKGRKPARTVKLLI